MIPRKTCYSFHDPQSQPNYDLSPESSYLEYKPSLSAVPSSSNHHLEISSNYHCIATFKSTSSYISSLALSGEFLYTGSSDREIRVCTCDGLTSELDRNNQNENIVISGKGAVKSLVVSSDKLFSAHQDHKIRVWKIEENESDYQRKIIQIATLPTLSDRALKFLVPKNHVKLRRHKKCTWVHHVDTVSGLALSEDESLLYSVSWDRTIKIWRTTDFKCLESVTNAHDDAINALALSAGGLVYTGSADKLIKVWKKIEGEKKHSLVTILDKHNSGINTIALNDDGSVLYSGACDKTIVVWEKDDGENLVVVSALRGHNKSVLCLSVVGNIVCSGSEDKTIRIWRGVERRYSCLVVLEGHSGPIKCLTATRDQHNSSHTACSCLLYSGSLECDIKVWQIFVSHL